MIATTTAAPTRPQLTPEQIASARLLDFGRYVRAGWVPSWHHEVLAQALTRVERGECRRLIVQMPPRHGKSTLSSTLFPSWYLGRHPDREVVVVSHAQRLASDFGRSIRNTFQSPEYKRVFPRVAMQRDSKSTSLFHVRPGDGSLYAVGMGGGLVGRGAHVLLIDDPVKDPKEADSLAIKDMQRSWYREVAVTRLAPRVGSIVIIMTRWRTDDLAGWCLDEFGDQPWEVISMPAVAEQDETWQLPGGRVVERRPGDLLWPGRFSEDEFKVIKQTLGSRGWSALYQQSPIPTGGGMCQLGWFKRYIEPPARFNRVVVSIDTAQKEQQINDPSAATVWGAADDGFYLLEADTARVSYPDLKRWVVGLADKWSPSAILIEDKASGCSLIQDLLRDTRLPVLAIEPQGNKQVRWQRVTPTIESGRVFLPERAPWLLDYESEVTAFPLAQHDDQVDSTSQFLDWIRSGEDQALPRLDGAAGQRLRDSLRRLGGGQARVRL